jgi:ribosomal protein L40E
MCVLLLSSSIQATEPNFGLGCPSNQVQVERGIVIHPSILLVTYGSDGYVDFSFYLLDLPSDVTAEEKSPTEAPFRIQLGLSNFLGFKVYVGNSAPIGEFPITVKAIALNGPLQGVERSCQFTLSIKQLEKFITMELSSSTVEVGEKVTVSGQVGYHVPSEVTVNGGPSGYWVYIEVSKGAEWRKVGGAQLTELDEYEYTFEPDEGGTYQVRAEWVYYATDTIYMGAPLSEEPDMILATSQILVLTVEPASVFAPFLSLLPVLLAVGILVAIVMAAVAVTKRTEVPKPPVQSDATTVERQESQGICKSCGNRNPAYATEYCVRCGAKLGSD